MPRAKRVRGLLVVASLATGVLLAELGCQIWLRAFATDEQQRTYAAPVGPGSSYLGHTPLYQPHHWLVYTLKSGYRSLKDPVRHNALGFRGPEIAVKKPAGTYRIAALGASTTYGTSIPDDALTYPAQLESHLRARYPGTPIEVINAGVPGYTSAENLMNLEFKVLDLSPDLLIVYHAHNDIHPRRQSVFRGDYTGYRKSWSGSTARERLFGWSALTRILGIRLNLWRPESIYKYTTTLVEERPSGEQYLAHFRRSHDGFFHRNLRTIVDVARGRGIDVILPTAVYRADAEPPGPYRDVYEQGMREHMAVVKAVAEQTRSGFFDFAAVMPATEGYLVDAVHVNAAGAELQGRLFAEFIATQGYIDRWRAR